MHKELTFFLSLLCLSLVGFAQTPLTENDSASKRHQWYYYWGYNRAAFNRSTLHFSSPEYEFTLFDVKAHDRPSEFGFIKYFSPSRISIPQYNYRVGFFISDRWSISGGVDHMKYVVDQGQKVLISGVISEQISQKYAGAYLQEEINLESDFLRFEHTDGLNLLTLDFEFLQPIVASPSGQVRLCWNTGLGGVWVVTRTDVRILGEGINNDFHVAGFSLAAKTGPRFEFFNKIFLTAEFKSGYMAIPDVLIENAAPKSAGHTIIFFEGYVALGTYFKL